MTTPVYNLAETTTLHNVSNDTKTVVLRRCWSVVFDVNGNAPADATIVSCATKELAEQVLTLFRAEKDDRQTTVLVIGGLVLRGLPLYVVEGCESDTYHSILEDWQPDSDIITSLEGLIGLFDEECPQNESAEFSDSMDGIFLIENESDDEDE